MPGGFLGIWRIATILSPVLRIHTAGAPSDSMGGRCLGGLSLSCRGRGLYPVQDPTTGLLEASARCSSSPYVPFGGYDPRGLVAGVPADVHLTAGDYASYFTTRLQARLPEVWEYSQERRTHRTPAYYRAQAQAEADAPAKPTGAMLGDVPFPPGMEVALDPALGLGPAIIIPVDLRQAPPPLQLDPEHATHMEVDRLRTRLEVEGIPLDFSEDEEDDDDGSSSDDAPPSPPSSARQAAAGPSRRRPLPPSPRHDLAEIAALCPVYLPDGIDPDQGLPLEPFLSRVLSMDANPSWVYRRTVFMMIVGETMYRVRDIALHVTNFSVYHRGCPMLLQAWALDNLDRSMAYFPDRINRQYGIIQCVPRIHDFESGPMTQSLLTNLADRWRN
ncbi:hypothetical protein JCGZ_06038 [Jatropha curcas]|uniref:Aminotransferase-like plant mobile domain-containing protein n=1 Tax=Jatropha curcas TaxID=180498 RepID=A0A067L1B7_JATCU|nr:hypothetical protein JCGZ_06038 [Jatropha curcas]